MNFLIIDLFFLLCVTVSILGDTNFETKYQSEYKTATDFVDKNHSYFVRKITENLADADILIPVVFPEIVRYSIYKDKMELLSLKVFYTNLGEDYSNFSVGLFQMKPSFVNQVELESAKLDTNHPFSYSETTPKDIRRSRIRRLENLDWQLVYLSYFYRIVNSKFQVELKQFSIEQKIYFFASAYNCGFLKDFQSIQNCGKMKLFPHGDTGIGENYCYSEIAIGFYKK